jgi:DNA polymerase-3 subunit delta
MDYPGILNNIKRGVFSPVYLFHGSEKLLINRVTEQIKSKLLNKELEAFNLDVLDGEKVPAKQVIDIANILPVRSETRVVIVKNPPYFLTTKGQEKDDEKALLDYLDNPNLSCCLIFQVNGKADQRKKIYKALEKSGQIVEFAPLDKIKLEQWIKAFFKEKGKTIDAQAVEYLRLVGSEGLEKLEKELEKLDLYCHNQAQISLEDVQAIISKNPEINIFNLLDSVANKEGKRALELLAYSLTMGEAPMAILYRLVNHFRMILIAKDMLNQGYSEKQIRERLKAHPYTISKILKQSHNFNLEQLVKALERLLEVEVQLKTGGGEAKELLETLVIQLCYSK